MALFWVNNATNNRFANKHLLVIGGSPTLQAMVDDGYEVFDARIKAYKVNKDRRKKHTAEAARLKDTYGVGKQPVTHNTLIVLSNGGLQSLTAAILDNGCQSDEYTVTSGVIFNMTEDDGYDVGVVATLDLKVRPCAGGHEVWHLEGADVVPLGLKPLTSAGPRQTRLMAVPGTGDLGLQFTPNLAELRLAKTGLKKTATKSTGGIPLWALSGATGVDLSFLDD